MRLVFAGTPDVALPSLERLTASRHEIVAVVTRPDAPQGRSKRLVPSPVAQWALARGIEVLRPIHPRDPEFQDRLTVIRPDCCPVVAYGALVPKSALVIPKFGWLNLHFSLLPKFRGAAPVQRAIMSGATKTGASVFGLVPELDAGAVFGTFETAIDDSTTSGALLGSLAETGADLLVKVLDDLQDGTAQSEEQDHSLVTFAPRIEVSDARIDWCLPATTLLRLIHACNPAPGAWTMLAGQRFKVLRVRHSDVSLPAGSLRVEKRSVLVGTGSLALELCEIQPMGKRPMAADAWGRGLQVQPGGFDS